MQKQLATTISDARSTRVQVRNGDLSGMKLRHVHASAAAAAFPPPAVSEHNPSCLSIHVISPPLLCSYLLVPRYAQQTGSIMASTAYPGMLSQSSTASRQGSHRSTPLASFKRPAKAPEGQRKRQKPHGPIRRLEGNSNGPSQATADHLDAEFRAEEAEDESLDLVIMAIDIRDRETVGCAYYVARHQSLMCMEDVTAGGKEVLDMLKLDIQPTVLLVSPRIDIETDNHNRLQAPPHASMLDDGMLTSMSNHLSS